MTRDEDEPLPYNRQEVAHPLDVAARAARAVGADFFRAFKRANSGDPREEVRGLVEMMVLTIRDGEMPGRDFVPLPAHLPDTEKEMRVLHLSKVAADQDMKRDLIEWAHGNYERADKAAKALENAVGAIRRAEPMFADPDNTDEELWGWCEYIRDHVLAVWKVDVREAPTDGRELAAWAMATVSHYDITPRFLVTGEQSRNAFMPDTSRRHGGPQSAADAMRPFRARGGDDD